MVGKGRGNSEAALSFFMLQVEMDLMAAAYVIAVMIGAMGVSEGCIQWCQRGRP